MNAAQHRRIKAAIQGSEAFARGLRREPVLDIFLQDTLLEVEKIEEGGELFAAWLKSWDAANEASKVIRNRTNTQIRKRAGFMLAEVCIGMALISMLIVILLGGITTAWFTRTMARDNSAATQIFVDRTETLRLASWDHVLGMETNSPVAFTENRNGTIYNGTITVEPSGISASYADLLRMITINVNWKTGNLSRHREAKTFVSQCGMQSYVY